jgi:hypothetical protein
MSGRWRAHGGWRALGAALALSVVASVAALVPTAPASAADTAPPGTPSGAVLIPHTFATGVATAMIDHGSGAKLECRISVYLVVAADTVTYGSGNSRTLFVQADDQDYAWVNYASTYGGPYTVPSGDWASGAEFSFGPTDGRLYISTYPNDLYYGQGQTWGPDKCTAQDIATHQAALEARAVNFKVWGPVQSRFTPSCTVSSQTGPGGSEINFDSAVDTDQAGYQQEWTFSDGTKSSASGVHKTAAKPGPFIGTHRAWIPTTTFDKSVTCTAEVKAPELGVSVAIVDAAGTPIPLDEPPGVDEVVDLRVRVSAGSDGVGPLTAITSPDPAWVAVTGGAELEEEPELPTDPFALQPGEHRDVMFRFRITAAGPLSFTAAVQGLDDIGRVVQADDTALESVGGIGVTVEVSYPHPPDLPDQAAEFGKDNDGNGVVDDRDNRVTVKVTAENLVDVDLTDVRLRDTDEPVDFVNRYLEGGAAPIGPIDGEEYDPDFGDLAVGETAVKEYVFLATGGVNADANVFLRAETPDDVTVGGFGHGRVQLQSHLALEVKMTMEERPYTSGQVVRLSGSLENLEEDRKLVDGTTEKAKSLVVVLTPRTEGNAGGGYVDGQSGGAPTPVDSDPVVILPGETLAIDAILTTQRSDVTSQAKVHYLVKAWEQAEDPDDLATRIDDSRIQFSEDDDSSAEHETTLAPDPIQADEAEECETTLWDAAVTCNLWVGLRTLAFGIKDLGFLIKDGIVAGADAYQRIILWEADMIRQTVGVLKGDPAARQALKTELEVQLKTWAEVGVMSYEALVAVGNAFTSGMNELQDVAARGDAIEITGMVSRFLGENPDLGLAALARIRLMRSVMLATFSEEGRAYTKAVRVVREANEAAALESRAGILERVEQAASEGKNPAEAGIFKGNEDVTDLPQVYRGVAGAREVDVQNALKIAVAEDVLVAFRSRSPRAAELLDNLEAWLKPQDVKTKTAGLIDTEYLGYRKSAYGKVELTEPPVDFGLTKPGFEEEFAAAVDAHMDKLKGKFPEIAADPLWEQEVRNRLIQRTKEYPKELANFSRYIDEGINIEFGYDKQGLDKSLEKGVADVRKAEVTPGVTTDPFGVERRYFELKMAGPNGGPFKWITGDIDIVAILNPDRTLLTDPVKRARVYEQLKELLGMQHGETLTYTDAEVQAKLLRDHVPNPDGTTTGVDTLFVAGNDGRLRTGFLQEGFSSAAESGAGTAAKPGFQLISGGPAQLITKPGGARAAFDTYEQTWSKLQQLSHLLLPGKADVFVDELTHDQVDELFDRSAKPIRVGQTTNPDGTTTKHLDVYVPGAATPKAGRNPAEGTTASSSIPEIAEVLDKATELGIDLERPVPYTGTGAAGGSWKPISVADALEGGDPDTLQQAPITSLPEGAAAGATTAAITSPGELAMDASSPFFAAGDDVVVDPGGPAEERAKVASVDPATFVVTFTAPLVHAHPAGTTMILLADVDPMDALVKAAYLDFLGRPVDPAGLAFWGARLRSGTETRASFVKQLSRSSGYAGIAVRRAYQSYLGRVGDDAGVAYWTKRIQQGLSVSTLPLRLMGSHEFLVRAGGTPGGFVDAAFAKVLGRAPHAAERAARIASLASGVTQASMARSLHASTESRRRRARAQFSLLLDRAPTTAELDLWVARLATEDDRGLAVALAASAEYLANAQR